MVNESVEKGSSSISNAESLRFMSSCILTSSGNSKLSSVAEESSFISSEGKLNSSPSIFIESKVSSSEKDGKSDSLSSSKDSKLGSSSLAGLVSSSDTARAPSSKLKSSIENGSFSSVEDSIVKSSTIEELSVNSKSSSLEDSSIDTSSSSCNGVSSPNEKSSSLISIESEKESSLSPSKILFSISSSSESEKVISSPIEKSSSAFSSLKSPAISVSKDGITPNSSSKISLSSDKETSDEAPCCASDKVIRETAVSDFAPVSGSKTSAVNTLSSSRLIDNVNEGSCFKCGTRFSIRSVSTYSKSSVFSYCLYKLTLTAVCPSRTVVNSRVLFAGSPSFKIGKKEPSACFIPIIFLLIKVLSLW